MFLRFGWLMAIRNLQRNALAIVGIALAATILVSSLLLTQGEPGGAQAVYRAAIGADLVVLPGCVALPGVPLASGVTWEWSRRDADYPGLTTYFFPELTITGTPYVPMSGTVSATQLAAVDGVRAVHPYQALPAFVHTESGWFRVWLRARDPEVDAQLGTSAFVTEGRYFTEADQDQMLALVDGWRPRSVSANAQAFGYDRWDERHPVLIAGEPAIRQQPPAPVGSQVTLYRRPSMSASSERTATLEVIGHFELQTRAISWSATRLTPKGLTSVSRNDPNNPGHYSAEKLHWALPEIWVTQETFTAVQHQLGVDEVPITEWLLVVDDFSRVNQVAETVRRNFPGVTVLTVGQLTQLTETLPEPMLNVPPEDVLYGYVHPIPPEDVRVSGPGWFQLALTFLGVAVAALLFLGNLYVLTLARMPTLAVLKALGSHTHQLLIAQLTEVAIIGGTGTLLGFAISSPLAIYQWLSNGLTWTAIVTRIVVGIGSIGGIVLIVCFALAGIPLWRVVRLSPREAIRGG